MPDQPVEYIFDHPVDLPSPTEPIFPSVLHTFLSFALYLVCFLSHLQLLTVLIHICYLICTALVHQFCSPHIYASVPLTTATLPTI